MEDGQDGDGRTADGRQLRWMRVNITGDNKDCCRRSEAGYSEAIAGPGKEGRR